MTQNVPAIKEIQHPSNAPPEGTTGFVPTKDELIQLVKFWTKKAIEDDYFIFRGQCFGSSDFRYIALDWKRVNEIAKILGEEEAQKAVEEAIEETAQDYEQSDWIVYRYGTDKAWAAYQKGRPGSFPLRARGCRRDGSQGGAKSLL